MKVLDELANKAIQILAKYEVINEKVRDIGERIKDHENRIIKLESTYDLNIEKVKNFFQQEFINIQGEVIKRLGEGKPPSST